MSTVANDSQQFVVTRKQLRELLFWAAHGVTLSRGGSYAGSIEMVIVDLATKLNLKIPYNLPYPEFGDALRKAAP